MVVNCTNETSLPLLFKLLAEKVIVVIFAPCSLPSKEDEVVVKETIEAILLATGKGHVQWVKDNPIAPEVLEEKIMSSIRSQEFPNLGDSRPTSAVEHPSNVPDMTVYDPPKAHSSQQRYPFGYARDQSQSQRGSFSPERPSVKGATSHTPETEHPSRSVKEASDSLHQSRHHSSSAAEPSHVRDSDKPERLSVSPLQKYGNTQVEVPSSGSGGTQKQLIGERIFHFVIVLFPFISPIQYSFMSYPARTKKPELHHFIHMLKLGKVNGQKWNNILISKRTVSSEVKQNSNNKDLSNPTNRTGLE